MNWLGAGLGSSLAAVAGAVLAAILQFHARQRGFDFPPIVGLLAGLAAALASRQKSGGRGVLVASIAVWAAAIAEVVAAPSHSIAADLPSFHERLDFPHALWYAACAATAALLSSRACSSHVRWR